MGRAQCEEVCVGNRTKNYAIDPTMAKEERRPKKTWSGGK